MNPDGQLPAKTRLLKAAADLLATSAGQPVTTRQITSLAGVTAPTLYHHFGDLASLERVTRILTHTAADFCG